MTPPGWDGSVEETGDQGPFRGSDQFQPLWTG